jgi:serine phosphatase RsbU (regulator of sigma subunit)
VIGDVMGKGPEAAAVTALARYTIRATAVTARRPSDVLRALNDALLRQLAEERRFCTAAIAYVTPDDGGGARVELASAGHPLPLRIAADGRVAAAGEHGMVLGIEGAPPLPDSALALGPGDQLVFFTDGVIEARHDGRMLGTAGLAGVLEGCAGEPPATIAARVQAAVTAQGPPRDDLAVLVLEALARTPVRAEERSASSRA